MNSILRTQEFADWFVALRDTKAKARITARIAAAAVGNFGDCKAIGARVSELRIDFGPGYRVYFTRTGTVVYLLLCGGHKSSQARDIRKAIALAKEL